jgi:ribosomal protein L1
MTSWKNYTGKNMDNTTKTNGEGLSAMKESEALRREYGNELSKKGLGPIPVNHVNAKDIYEAVKKLGRDYY